MTASRGSRTRFLLNKPGAFKLGLYHSIGHTYFGFTGYTKGKDKGKSAAKLLNWAKNHSKAYLLTTKTLLPEEWQQDMMSREKPNRFVHSVFKCQAKLLSPWWTTVTFFNSFTSHVHTDVLDHQPLFLFNFGAPCYLVLHDYNLKIQLDHLDIAVFNTNTLRHSTASAGDGERWAFSTFYRKSIYAEMGPLHISNAVLDEILGTEEETRIQSANR
ncbi:uncharacterized protein SRS1_25016 [Sporisorium reilianum f. sp. reilianum]|uniref:Uncharacterized protein n=1 Tax=Sporisorium reilianum f. sp. reilianum TaxID=72559 RepID=A0A2N8UJZ2_9BASI|nr:uncharacterized protein SRS1_25016 [Sporisorium reilianum f. sp. reilianum]